MPAFLLPLLSNWKLIIGGLIGVAVIGFGIYFNNLCNRYDEAKATIVEQRGQIDEVQAKNATLDKTIADLKVQQKKQLDVLTADRDAAVSRAAKTSKTIQVIRNAPPSSDAPVAPVLSDALDSLRKRPRAAPGGAGPSGAAVSP